MADSEALRSRRYRAHRDGDHSLCRHGSEPGQDAAGRSRLERAVRGEFPESDELSRALALRLTELAAGQGAAAVQACRALGELVAAQRDPVS